MKGMRVFKLKDESLRLGITWLNYEPCDTETVKYVADITNIDDAMTWLIENDLYNTAEYAIELVDHIGFTNEI